MESSNPPGYCPVTMMQSALELCMLSLTDPGLLLVKLYRQSLQFCHICHCGVVAIMITMEIPPISRSSLLCPLKKVVHAKLLLPIYSKFFPEQSTAKSGRGTDSIYLACMPVICLTSIVSLSLENIFYSKAVEVIPQSQLG